MTLHQWWLTGGPWATCSPQGFPSSLQNTNEMKENDIQKELDSDLSCWNGQPGSLLIKIWRADCTQNSGCCFLEICVESGWAKKRARANTTVSKETYCLMHCVLVSSQCIDYSQLAANINTVFEKCEVAGFVWQVEVADVAKCVMISCIIIMSIYLYGMTVTIKMIQTMRWYENLRKCKEWYRNKKINVIKPII